MRIDDEMERLFVRLEHALVEIRRVRRRVQPGTRGKIMTTTRTPAAKRIRMKRYYRKKKIQLKLRRKAQLRSPAFVRRTVMLAKKASKRRGEAVEPE